VTRTVSLDLDAVLIQNPFRHGVLPHLRRHLRRAPSLAKLGEEKAGRRIRDAVEAEVGRRMASGRLATAYDWDAIYAAVAASFGAPPVPDVAELVRHYCTVPGTIWLLPGALEALDGLAADGYRLVATTNGFARYQRAVLEALEILDRFDELRAPDTVGFAKPDPRIVAGVRGLVAHVGDMLYHDVLMARRLGVTAVWVHDPLPEPLRSLPASERTRDTAFDAYLDGVRDGQPYAAAHPEATVAELRPDHVVVGVGETPGVLAAAARMERAGDEA
jgi:FMN phosphatase YigB (HAD superfamily)